MADANDSIVQSTSPHQDSAIKKVLRCTVNAITKINMVVGEIMSYTLLLLLFLIILEVFRRYVLKNPSIWGFDLSLWLFGMPALLAGGYVLAEHGHVNMDMLYNKFSPRTKAIVDCITSIAFFIFIIIMFIQCCKAVELAIVRGEMSITNWKIKIWPVKLWMPVAAGLTLIQGAAEFIKNLYMAITGRSLIE